MRKCKKCGELTDEGLKTPIGFLCYLCADEEEYHECEYCGKVFKGDWTDLGETAFICNECLDEYYIICDECGEVMDPDTCDDIHSIGDKYYCGSCFKNLGLEEDEDEDEESL